MATVDDLWNDVDDSGKSKEPIRPLWAINLKSDLEIINWFKNTFNYIKDEQEHAADKWKRNLQLYKGEHAIDSGVKIPRDRIQNTQSSLSPTRYAFNDTYEIVEQWVSKMTGFKGNVSIAPANDENKDRNMARIAEDVVKYLSYVNNMEAYQEKLARYVRIFGEIYFKVFWDPAKGPLHPDYVKAREEGTQLKIKGDDGEDIYIDTALHVGDVGYEILAPWRVYVFPVEDWSEAECVIIEYRQDIDRVKAMYQDKKINFSIPGETSDTQYQAPRDNKVSVFEIWHAGTDLLESGAYIKIVGSTILENTPHPYSHKQLPIIRLTDIDVPGQFRAMSTVDNVGPLNILRNKTSYLISKAMAIGSHLKWIMPKGAVTVSSLGNSATVVEYTGGVPPRLEMPRTTTPDMFQFRNDLRQDIERISGVHGVSRGEPPPGIRAGIALQFLEEQENQRANSAILKHNAMIREIWRHTLAIAGDMYDESDGRLINILGKNNQYKVRDLRDVDLSTPFDIRVQNSSSLPDSKAGKVQSIIDLKEAFPDLVPNNQVADILDLAQPDKYIDWVAVAIQKAESENDRLLEGEEVAEPKNFEEQITHWQTHMKVIQSANFDKVPEKVQQMVFDHILAHEYLMYMQTTKVNGAGMSQKLQALEGWPAFFEIPEPDMEAAQAQSGVPPEQMAEGAPQPGQQPGQSPVVVNVGPQQSKGRVVLKTGPDGQKYAERVDE